MSSFCPHVPFVVIVDSNFSCAYRASQKERISMLKMALEEKGVNTSSMHYDMRMSVAPSRPAADTSQAVSAGQGDELAEAGIHQGQAGDRDDGLYL